MTENHERKEEEMNERRMPANDSGPMTEEEELEAYAARQMWGRGTWEYIEEDADGTPVLHIGPIPPESAWEGKKTQALAAARVHRRIAEDIGRVIGELDGAFDEADEASDEPNLSSEMRAYLFAIRHDINAATFGLRGILRDGDDGDDMDIGMTSLFHAIFDEMVAARPPDSEETPS